MGSGDHAERERAARVAVNQATFRSANKHIAEKAAELDVRNGLLPFICECERRECREIVRMNLEEYGHIRVDSARFAVAHGHAGDAEIEISATDRYAVVQKQGAAAEIAATLDADGA